MVGGIGRDETRLAIRDESRLEIRDESRIYAPVVLLTIVWTKIQPEE
jgi:hypothetical protein